MKQADYIALGLRAFFGVILLIMVLPVVAPFWLFGRFIAAVGLANFFADEGDY